MNQSKEIKPFRNFTSRRWVLVAGTGIPNVLSSSERFAARAIGKALAEYQYGLVSGGWPGVDEIVTKNFIDLLRTKSLDPADYMIQVVTEGKQILHNEGYIVRVPQNPREWLEAQKFADAIILIGGRGGTYVTWLGALHDGMPRFPLGKTSGDADTAFKQTFNYWELMPVPGIDQSQFKELGRSIRSESDATWLAKYLIEELLPRSLDAVDAVQRRNTNDAKSMFISYSRKDEEWVSRLRTLLRPAEKRGLLSTWVDTDIEEGIYWESQIQRQLNNSNFALLLMSKSLLESDYVKNVELPAFMQRLEKDEPSFRLFWVLLEPCNWKSFSGLEKIQAIGSVITSISECCTEADKQCRLIQVVEEIVQALS
ncbi:MAG: TIR domain-containing protein [Waterburya sp.]